MSYKIFTDSSCDLTTTELDGLQVTCLAIGLTIAGKEYPGEYGGMPTVDEFYQLQAESGGATGTAGLTTCAIMEAFEPALAAGEDVLYLGIVPELSQATQNSLHIALMELEERYPERRIEAPNTHSIAPGLGLMVDRIATMREQGASLDDVLKQVDYLAGLLHIHPIMRLPYDGKLESVSKVRGSKAVLKELAGYVHDSILEPDGKVWISYGGESQRDRAEALKALVREYCPDAQVTLHRIGPIIGAHTGETVLAVFFFSNER